jgi:hypothetical protein
VDHSGFLLKFATREADLASRMPNSDRHSVRRVVLPSGRTIDVVYFEDVPPPETLQTARSVEGLHVCSCCESKLVHPISWTGDGPSRWEITLQCPNCGWVGGGSFERELVDQLEDELDRGTKLLVRDLKRLVRANMEDEIDRFVHALEADAILPMDF